MTKIAIFPGQEGAEFLAVAGDKQSVGKTAGEALDALTPQLPQDAAGTLIILQSWRPDAFFGAAEQTRLAELMEQWRNARDRSTALPPADRAELDALVATELRAAEQRSAQMLRELGE